MVGGHLARQHAPEALVELARLSLKAKSETASIAAIRELLDRAYGKARQSMEIQTPQQASNIVQDLLDEIDARQRQEDPNRPQFHTPQSKHTS
jgi:hypothetical protein